jgi:hypothetical protein
MLYWEMLNFCFEMHTKQKMKSMVTEDVLNIKRGGLI